MEIIGLIIAVAGLYIAYITLKKSFPSVIPEPIEEKNNLLVNFKTNQILSIEVQNLISTHIQNNDAANNLIFEGVTFEKYLTLMKSEFNKCLSNELYEKISKETLTKPNIQSMLESLTVQKTALTELKGFMLTLS